MGAIPTNELFIKLSNGVFEFVSLYTFSPRIPNDVRQGIDVLDHIVIWCPATNSVDPVYRRMCRNQRCFRARVSPKPWRIGLTEHLRPRPGVWPVKPERLPQRNEWIRRYESQAGGGAACAFVEAVGSPQTHPRAHQVMKLHDLKSQAMSRKPIA